MSVQGSGRPCSDLIPMSQPHPRQTPMVIPKRLESSPMAFPKRPESSPMAFPKRPESSPMVIPKLPEPSLASPLRASDKRPERSRRTRAWRRRPPQHPPRRRAAFPIGRNGTEGTHGV
ncbi:hypothetical protein ILYODFUR_029084 [Ilyodon furcidens]|uniref:Uncharacterized protein n=1 Tax=Ilyodon furcidens TaxID=33524 RepID=A0ABV0STM3_9TELE